MASILERNKKVAPKKKTREDYAEDALYREVWEEVNNEKTMAFVKKYSRYIIGGVLAIMIITTAAVIGVRTHRAHKIAVAQSYETAVNKMDADMLSSVAENAGGATGDLALFQSYLLDNDITKLEQLANDAATRDMRDLARLHIVGLRGDDMTAAAIEDYLAPLDTKKSPYYYTSRLMVAQKYLSTGDRENANKWLDVIINDENAPAVISATAQTLR
ncbi:MAG: hypothetical protein IAC69_01075 [Proteobacteria bacterium]|uniref:Tetratricopeptide repeat-like domain-containing protein n=1 Tax=Candidatus Enterousia avistercoris TaxID=2840788 RepID=A0A9D9DE56_9PROT|nr:hypothetical protein [Candidatus Enterousia avistercoris]